MWSGELLVLYARETVGMNLAEYSLAICELRVAVNILDTVCLPTQPHA